MYPRVKVRYQEEPVEKQKEDTSCIVRAISSLSLESHSSRIQVSTHGSQGENDSHPPYARISISRRKDPLTPSISGSKGNSRIYENSKIQNNGFNKDIRCQNSSYLQHARISESHPKSSSTSSPVVSKGKNNNGLKEDNKTNIRASSVPRPRAVLSSPDNDGIIGSQNESIREKRTPLRRQTLDGDGITGQQSLLIRQKRALAERQTSSPRAEAQTKVSCSRLGSPNSTGKVLKGAGNNGIMKRGRSSELPAPRQRPPYKVG